MVSDLEYGKQLKRRLWNLGHFRNPEMPTDALEDELDALPLTSDAVKTAIRSYQSFDRAAFDALSIAEHGRPGVADGVLGPATMQLLSLPRCGEADFPADVEAAVGRGSWPAGCTQEYPDNHTFAIHWDKSNMPAFLIGIIDQCIERCYAAYRDMGIVFITTSDPDQANTRVTWQRGSGWIGLAIVGQGQTCSTRGRNAIWAKFDTRYRPSRLVDQWSRLLAHEFGHNMGLRHSRGGIMNPSISQGPFTETAWRGDPSESILTRWFGGVPVPPRNDTPDPPGPDDPDPQPGPPTDGKVTFRGELQAFVGDKPAGKFIVIPKPEV